MTIKNKAKINEVVQINSLSSCGGGDSSKPKTIVINVIARSTILTNISDANTCDCLYPSLTVRYANCIGSANIRMGARLFIPTPVFSTTKSLNMEGGCSVKSVFHR